MKKITGIHQKGLDKIRWIIFTFFFITIQHYPLHSQHHRAIFFNLNNDYFTGTDQYYTHGATFGVLIDKPTFKREGTLSVALSQDIFTPSTISVRDLQVNDHPYAGLMKLQIDRIFYNSIRGIKLRHHLDAGIMGPRSQAEAVQKWFHKLIGDELPQGWHNQVDTRIIFNYGVTVEKRLLNVSDHFELISGAGFFAGTLENGADLSMRMRWGKLTEYFKSPFSNQEIRFEFYSDFNITYLLNDGILGSKTADNVPVVNDTRYNNARWEFSSGVKIAMPKIQLEFSITKVNEPFEGANNHRYGTLSWLIFI